MIQWQSDVVPSKIDRRLRAAYQCYRPFEQALLKRSNRVIVASEPYLEHSDPLKKWSSKCSVVPLGADPGRLPWPSENLRRTAKASWKPGTLRVIAVGRMTYYKGFDVLIRAAQKAPGISVQIVGEGALKKSLERQIARMGLENRVVMRGELSDPEYQSLLATCHVLCLSSIERTEAFGLVLLEVMRYGKALVVSDIPGSGAGWVARKGACGFLFPPGEADALAAIFERLTATPSLCDQMGQKEREIFWKTFHIQSVARRIREIYERILLSA